MSAFKTIRTQNRELMSIQDNVQDALRFLDLSLITDGVLVGPVTITTANTTIAHTLNRMPLGWFPVNKKGLGDIFEISKNASNLTLKSSVTVISHFWCF